ncbi:hypothetical protein [Vibrio harveyi]|uniref:hypothetical protein n=1 Tax=Vibrio harveyi TaxID=669 RepID=UPI0025B0AC0C|nr:hypothetical protein [Vibrio harveyi]WJT11069.1 hypothetical protein PH545_28415 [Vibrio harveyi]
MSRDMKKSKLALTLALLLGVNPVAFANTAIVNEVPTRTPLKCNKRQSTLV